MGQRPFATRFALTAAASDGSSSEKPAPITAMSTMMISPAAAIASAARAFVGCRYLSISRRLSSEVIIEIGTPETVVDQSLERRRHAASSVSSRVSVQSLVPWTG